MRQFRLLSARWSTYTTNFASRYRAKNIRIITEFKITQKWSPN
nr:MAG TPA: hypothetical protein [Caudoviricetes sp.]